MRNISIKREQSQAGLSFAKRENRRSLAGGESKFRPQVKNKLFLLLALLLTAVTGAWAQTETLLTTITATGEDSYSETTTGVVTVTLSNVCFYNEYGWVWCASGSVTVEAKEGYTITKCVFKQNDKTPVTITTSPFAITFSEYGYCEQDGEMDGVTSIEVYESAAPAATTYSVKMKEGTEDADHWTISPNPAAEGQTVTIEYTGQKEVKRITAVKKAPAEATPALSITSPSVGQVIGSDGKNYAYGSLPTGVTAVAKICYVSGSNGLALALTDEGKMEWSTAIETCAAHTAPFTGGTWKLATKDEWDNMISAAGSYSALHDGFSSVGGTNMQSDFYWSSTEEDSDDALYYDDYNYNPGEWDHDVKESNLYVRACLAFTVEEPAVNLSTLTADYVAQDGDKLTGTLAGNYKISIADGATVTLDGVTINGVNDYNYEWAGITCEGDATIILSGTNTVKGFYEEYPGIQAAADKTLIINGTGSLTASSYGYGAGIGGGFGISCGNIEIQGGTITATSVTHAAGIGGGKNASWGNITISGGTVTATGGEGGAGIGGGKKGSNGSVSSGNILISGGTVTATGGENAAGIGGGNGYNTYKFGSCGTITITTGVTKVTATMGDGATNSIGAGKYCDCGTVTIGGNVGAITTSPYTYDPSAPAAAEGHALSASAVGEIVGSDGKAYAVADKDNLPEGVTAVAIVAYKGSETGEASPYTHGLAIAMKDAAAGGKVKWSSSDNDESLDNYTDYSPAVTTAQSGLSDSQTSGFDNESNYPAFYAALHNTITVSDGISAAAPASGTSGWFLPSLYQWNMIVKGLSGKTADLSHGGNANANYTASSLNPKIEAAGGTGLQSGAYWPSTEYSSPSAWYFYAGNGSVGYRNKTGEGYVRSAFAF